MQSTLKQQPLAGPWLPERPTESFHERRIRNKTAELLLVEWYESWLSWQKQGLLCGIARRCSNTHIHYLLSSLEPVFHRDYCISDAGEYPWKMIGGGRKPIRLNKVRNKRYKKSHLLIQARKALRERAEAEAASAPTEDSSQPRGEGEKPKKKKSVSLAPMVAVGKFKKGKQLKRPSDAVEPPKPAAAVPKAASSGFKKGFKTGAHSWLKVKTVRMMDPSLLIGEKDFGLEMREELVDGLGVWTGAHTRRHLPTPGPPHHHVIKSSSDLTAIAALARSREHTKSSISYRPEEVYTPSAPRSREQRLAENIAYRQQLKSTWKWFQSLTDVELGEVLGGLVSVASSADLRYLTSCLVARCNERYDVNCLTDSLLLHIFDFLPPADLLSAAQVCRRWHHLALRPPVWLRHCLHLGATIGMDSVEKLTSALTEGAEESTGGDSIDWKQAYLELEATIQLAQRQLSQSDDASEWNLLRPESPTLVDAIVAVRPFIHYDSHAEASDEEEEVVIAGRVKKLKKKKKFVPSIPPSPSRSSPLPTPETTLSDIYSIHSLMGREERWKLHINTGRLSSRPDTQTALEELALELGGQPDEGQTEPGDESLPSPARSPDKFSSTTSVNEQKVSSRMEREAASPFAPSTIFSFEKLELAEMEKRYKEFAVAESKPKKSRSSKMSHMSSSTSAVGRGKSSVPSGGRGQRLDTVPELETVCESSRPGRKDSPDQLGQAVAVEVETLDLSRGAEDYGDRLGHRDLQDEEQGHRGIDIRPPPNQPHEIVAGNVAPYKRVWKYPSRFHRFYGALYENRVLGIESLTRLEGHMDGVICLRVDSRRILSGSLDLTLRIWALKDGKCVRKLYGHRGSVSAIDFTPDILVTGSWDMSIMVWSATDFSYVSSLYGHRGKITALHIDPDHNILYSSSHDATIRVWDLSAGIAVKVLQCPSPVTMMRVLDTGILFSSSDGVMRLVETPGGEEMEEMRGHSSEIKAFTVTGDLLISGSSDGQVLFWNLATRELESGIQAHDQAVLALHFHRRKFFTGSADSSIKEWDLVTMTCMRVLHGHRGPVRAIHANDKRIISCSDDGDIRVWNLFDPLEK